MSNENLTDVMRRRPIFPDEPELNGEPVPSVVPTQQAQTEIQRATGMRLPKFAQEETEESGSTFGVLTPDEAAQFGPGTKIDVEKEADDARNRNADMKANAQRNDVINLISEAQANEEQRLADQEEYMSDPEKRAEKFQGQDIPGETRKVEYRTDYKEDTPKQVERSQTASAFADEDDLLPSYDFEDIEPVPQADEQAEEEAKDAPKPGEKEYTEYLKNLETVDIPADTQNPSIISVVQEKVAVEPVPSNRMSKAKTMGDQAFMSSINKFKKDNFRSVSVPLVNSGFSVDIVGTGSVDLTLLYSAVDQNTLAVDYEIEKMRTIMRNVVGTHPQVDRNSLRNMIHFADYQLMAYAHIAATLKTVETIQTCDECGKDFHIIANSSDLILNMDELRDKMEKIKNADSINQYSLMAFDNKITTNGGFIINIGHPSYSEYIQYMSELKDTLEKLTSVQSARITQMSSILPYVRSVLLPNNVHTSTLYQRFIAITMLSDEDYNQLSNEINKMVEKIILPKFGIRNVECPHCKKINTNIAYENLNDLLFFHITVTRLLNEIEE